MNAAIQSACAAGLSLWGVGGLFLGITNELDPRFFSRKQLVVFYIVVGPLWWAGEAVIYISGMIWDAGAWVWKKLE